MRVQLTFAARSVAPTLLTITTVRVQAQKEDEVDEDAYCRIGGVSLYRGFR